MEIIPSLKGEHGNSVHDMQEIKRLAITFYKNLLGSSSHDFSSEKAENVARLIKKKFYVVCIEKNGSSCHQSRNSEGSILYES